MLPLPATRPATSIGSNGNSSPESGTETAASFISVITFQGYLTTRQILINTNTIVKQLDNLINFFHDQSIKDDQDKEKNSESKPLVPEENTGLGLGNLVKDFLALASLKTIVLGLVTAFTLLNDEYQKFAKETLAGLLVARKSMNGAIELLRGTFELLIEPLKVLGRVAVYLKDILTSVVKSGLLEGASKSQEIAKIFESFGKFFSIFGKIGKAITTILDVFLRPLVAIIDPLIEGLPKIARLIMRGLGKLLIPLQVALSIFDFANGFLAGLKKEGIEEGIKEGLEKVFDGLVISIFDLVKKFTTWILKNLGLDNLSAAFDKGMEDLEKNLKKIFRDVLDIFGDLAHLDLTKLWTDLKTGAADIYTFIKDNIKNEIIAIVAFFKDFFNLDLNEVFSTLKTQFLDKIKDAFSSFVNAIYEWTKSLLHSTLSATVGDSIANKVLGSATATQNDINAKAETIAKARVYNGLSSADQYQVSAGIQQLPPVFVTDEDKAKAIKELTDSGYIISAPVKQIDTIISRAKQLSDNDVSTTTNNSYTYNDNSVKSGGTSRTSMPVVVSIPIQDNASKSNPRNRN